jgi:PAS domain S-box-containing protein
VATTQPLDGLYLALVDQTPDALVVSDPAGTITLINRQSERLFGYAREDLLGRPVEELLPQRFHAVHRQHRADALAALPFRPLGTPVSLWGRRRDGSEFPIEVTSSSLRTTGAARAHAVMSSIRDQSERLGLAMTLFTERVQAAKPDFVITAANAAAIAEISARLDETGVPLTLGLAVASSAIAAAEARATALEATIEAIPEAVAVYDAAGRLMRTNAAMRRLLPPDADSGFLTLPFAERAAHPHAIHPNGRPLSPEEDGLTRILRGETLASGAALDLVDTLFDGREMCWSITGAPLRDEDGRVVGAVMVWRDVTELRRLERELAERAGQLETTIEAIADSLHVVDTEGRLVRTNAAFRALWAVGQDNDFVSLPPEERTRLVGAHYPDGRPMPQDEWPITRVLRGEMTAASAPVDVVMTNLAGREMTISSSGAPIMDAAGQVVGAVLISRDVTAQRQLEHRAHEALGALLAMAQALVEPAGPPEPVAPRGDAVSRRLAQLTCDVLGCRRVGLQVVDRQTRLVRPLAVVGLDPALEPQWWAEQEARQVRYGEDGDPALLARFEAGEAVVIDLREAPYNQVPNPYGITTSLYAPLRVRGETVGILSLDYGGEPHVFTTEDRALAEAVGQLAAVVIERDRLLREREEG